MTPSPAEFVKSLSESEQDAVLEALLELVYARWNHTTGIVTLRSPKGKAIGYLVPPYNSTPALTRMIEEMPDEVREKMFGPIPADIDWDDCLTEKELEELRQEAFARVEKSNQPRHPPQNPRPRLFDYVTHREFPIELPNVGVA